MKPATILSVDDDAQLQGLLKNFLEEKGYHVLTSSDGWDGIRQIIMHKPDLVVMDLEMPKLGGLNTLETLKATNFTEHTPILVASAHADQETILKAIKLGAEDFIVKPFSFEQLTKRIHQLLFNVDYKLLQKILHDLQRPEGQSTAAVWSGLDLQKYKNWSAFPFIMEGREICVLLPHGLKISAAAKLNEQDASQNVVILAKFRNTWKGVWPHND